MAIFVSKTTKAFYDTEICSNPDYVPCDGLEISESLHKALLQGCAINHELCIDFDVHPPTLKKRDVEFLSIATMKLNLDSRITSISSSWSRMKEEYSLRAEIALDYKKNNESCPLIDSIAKLHSLTNIDAADFLIEQYGILLKNQKKLVLIRMRKHELDTKSIEDANIVYNNIMLEINDIANELKPL